MENAKGASKKGVVRIVPTQERRRARAERRVSNELALQQERQDALAARREAAAAKAKRAVRQGKARAAVAVADGMQDVHLESGDDVDSESEVEAIDSGMPDACVREQMSVVATDGRTLTFGAAVHRLLVLLDDHEDGEYIYADTVTKCAGIDLCLAANAQFVKALRGRKTVQIFCTEDGRVCALARWCAWMSSAAPEDGLRDLFQFRLPPSFLDSLCIEGDQLAAPHDSPDLGMALDALEAEGELTAISDTAGKCGKRTFFPKLRGMPINKELRNMWHAIKLPAAGRDFEKALVERGLRTPEELCARKERRSRAAKTEASHRVQQKKQNGSSKRPRVLRVGKLANGPTGNLAALAPEGE